MVSATPRPAVTGVRLSSVVPASVSGENKDRHLTGLDLAMKLHYIKAVYFFDKKAVEGLTIEDMKKPMFPWLQLYYPAAGRIRRDHGEGKGRPFIKCNDGGVRIVEANCPDWTVQDWLRLPAEEDRDGFGVRDDDCLAFDQVLGPDLGFSPLVYLQFTWFNCGGLSVGLSWAHVLGDPFSACTFINTWAHLLHGQVTPDSLHQPRFKDPSPPLHPSKKNLASLNQVEPVGDSWRAPSNPNTRTHTFRVTAQQLNDLASRSTFGASPAATAKISYFDILSAIIWKSVAKVGEDSSSGPRTVTICWNKSSEAVKEHELPSNKMAVGTVHTDFMVAKCEVSELAELIAEKKVDESDFIEEAMANGEFDCVMYGANLTFVNLEEARIDKLQMKGWKPLFANYKIEGVGKEGTVLVLPDCSEKGGEESGKVVTIMLSTKQLTGLKEELRKSWGII